MFKNQNSDLASGFSDVLMNEQWLWDAAPTFPHTQALSLKGITSPHGPSTRPRRPPTHTHTAQRSLSQRYFPWAQKMVALERPIQAGQDLSVESPSELVGYVAVWSPGPPPVWVLSPGFAKVVPKGPQLSVCTYEA